tara:strand:+ start:107 stop:889 length:783 start_codon:yes stop_codon:yes gene_type:complete
MLKSLHDQRVININNFLKSLKINSAKFHAILNNQNLEILSIIDEALTHSSANKGFNHEKLEFFGDAVLRLSASEFIDNYFKNMKVGQRSLLRAQIVSDEWLTKFGKKINLEEIIIVGPKAMGDFSSKDTIIAETTEALIGAFYKCFKSIKEINIWLDQYWFEDAKIILEAPYKFNAKSTLQEWCQEKGINLPNYKICEISKTNGDPKRFFCELYISGIVFTTSYGQSHKRAEKNAARKAIEMINKGERITKLIPNYEGER